MVTSLLTATTHHAITMPGIQTTIQKHFPDETTSILEMAVALQQQSKRSKEVKRRKIDVRQ